ncbi:Disease resistance protein TIR-NBS-LRR class family [Prunus dulcis]|uniref:Disease resistance protein TIR-NBS-LRR class family n=1 Tax=Prunus dulcis TaxID=3755 RepID=A0A5H2XN91_PRUDU|nr:Disease resistance protein TIR-NBS-LRR class family [Prunus dulcis]
MIYLTLSRPDTAFAMNHVCQFMHHPCSTHLQAVKRIYRYIKGTLEQSNVSRSSSEAEYRALATTTAELCWFGYLFRELGIPLCSPPCIFVDNISALHMAANPVFHARTRHVEIDYHFCSRTHYVPSSSQLADLFANNLSRERKAHKASSSSSPSTSSSKRLKYDVFLSFRGEDTRKGFTGHLHAALSDAGISTFLDDNELERAEFIKTQLEQAIDKSIISIIVFSKSYADSSWCLDELVKIMECRERLGKHVIPLFYSVDASDVRNQKGSFAQAFEKHEGKHEKEKVQRWKKALTQAADLCGEDLKNADNGHEAKFINKILGVVNKLLDIKSQLDIKHPVGITSRVKALSNHLHIENSGSKDDVRMIGIWGMGGIGKTTLAKAIYNEFESSFEGRSFLENVREVTNQPMGLVRLQKQLLNDILKSEGVNVDSVLKGIEMIRRRLPCKRALVIIDDADDLHQLEAIAGARDWFGPGSRILITTRNQHLLQQVGVDGTYIAEKMDEEEALEFFSWHAFKRRYPEYLDLSKRVIRYCQGLPLALRVVGSFLFNRSIAEWESHLEKLRTSPDGDIQKILRISFEGLPDDTTKKIFLDISCFFIGDDKDYVTKILDGCGFYATIGISVLIERCLVTVNEQKELMMHDLLRDMGREIVYENANGRPEEFSRLWKHEDVTNVLNDESGTEKIEGVALHGSYGTRFSAQAFTNMKKLSSGKCLKWRQRKGKEKYYANEHDCMILSGYEHHMILNTTFVSEEVLKISKITEEGVTISQPYSLKTFWGFSAFENPTLGAEGSWSFLENVREVIANQPNATKAIAGARDWFGPGSRIVITTRNQHLLDKLEWIAHIWLKQWMRKRSSRVFSWHAFERRYPDQEYLDLSKRVIRYCQGLPLALRVGTKKIEGVALRGSDGTRFSAQAFTNMKKLSCIRI